MSGNCEKLFSINIEGNVVRGVAHLGNNKRVIVYCPGLAGERVDCNRLPVDFGRIVSNRGWDLIRFDYRGTGTSDGDIIQFGFMDLLRDVEEVVMGLEQQYETIYLLGISQAAIQCYYLLGKIKYISGLILWSPVWGSIEKRASQSNQLLPSNLLKERTHGFVRMNKKFMREPKTHELGFPNTGMWINRRFFVERAKVLNAYMQSSCLVQDKDILVFVGDLDMQIKNDVFLNNRIRYVANNWEVIQGGDHLFSNYCSRKMLYMRTIDVLSDRIGS